MNQTPAAGAIAQWNSGANGHVAYVESVDSGGAGITITEDHFMPESGYGSINGGYTAQIHITSGSSAWPANFIHFKDLAAPIPADTDSAHTVSGDFNRDGYSDTISFYNYGGDNTSAFIFRGNPNGVGTPVRIWNSGPGNWRWENTKLIAGDFNHDGYADVVAFYNYGGDNTSAFIFRGNPNGVGTPVQIWNSGPGNWRWENM